MLASSAVAVATANIYISTSNLVGIGTQTPGSNLHVVGNIYASNALVTTNIIASAFTSNTTNTIFNFDTLTIPFINSTTLNVAAASNLSSLVTSTLNVASTANIASLTVTGVSNLTTLNVSGTTNLWTLYYNEDLVRRAPHLRPDTSNSTVISGWISAQSNIVRQQGSFWAPATRPIASNLTASPMGSNAYIGAVALSDFRTIFIPYGSNTFGIFNSQTNQFSSIIPSGSALTPTSGWGNGLYFGGVQAPSGNIVCIPHQSANIGVFDPEGYRFSNSLAHGCPAGAFAGGVLDGYSNVTMVPYNSLNVCSYNGSTALFSNMVQISGTAPLLVGGVLLPSGNIMCIPFGNSNLVQYSPAARTYSNSALGSGFFGGVLAPNGNVVCIPYSAANVVVVNPTGNPPYSFSNLQVGRVGGGGFAGGVLLPSGSIACIPLANSNVGLVDPGALTYANIVPQGGAAQSNAWAGGALTPDGRVVFVPCNSTNVAVLNTTTPVPSTEFRLAPYFNKF